MQGKLNPVGTAKVNFPGFQEILDFTSAGTESSVSVTVDGDTDKEYIICVSNLLNDTIEIRLNSDNGTNYGWQYINNSSGTITANRNTTLTSLRINGILGVATGILLTPSGFIKTLVSDTSSYSSGTTVSAYTMWGKVWNSTANVTQITFFPASGNFASGTRIYVGVRRSQ